MLTIERARELLSYDPLTGALTYLVDRPGRGHIKAGDPAGSFRADGYGTVMIDGKRYLLHRLAWLLMTGEWPLFTIDHEDTDPSNNRWINLRPATGKQNSANRNGNRSTALGVKGVRKQKGRFIAQIQVDGKIKYLGSHIRVEDAVAAYNTAAKIAFGDFARMSHV